MKFKKYIIDNVVSRWAKHHFFKHYVLPFLIRGRKEAYNPKEYFEKYHSDSFANDFSDEATISPAVDPYFSKIHYRSAEISILRAFVKTSPEKNAGAVLDIGSGSGHWIDFFDKLVAPESILGVEISNIAVACLRKKYSQNKKVSIEQGNVSDINFGLGRKFDVISAIGVMFHIVDDNDWRNALLSLKKHLSVGGLVVIGGQFGLITQNVQFESSQNNDLKVVEVNKRIRSMRFWRKVCKEVGLKVVAFVKTTKYGGIFVPENNILVLKHR